MSLIIIQQIQVLQPEARHRHRDRKSKVAAVIAAVAAMMLIALLARGSSQVVISTLADTGSSVMTPLSWQ